MQITVQLKESLVTELLALPNPKKETFNQVVTRLILESLTSREKAKKSALRAQCQDDSIYADSQPTSETVESLARAMYDFAVTMHDDYEFTQRLLIETMLSADVYSLYTRSTCQRIGRAFRRLVQAELHGTDEKYKYKFVECIVSTKSKTVYQVRTRRTGAW